MEHERQDSSRIRDVGYTETRALSGPAHYERTADQKAADAATIANNFDGPLMVVTEAVAQVEAAADAGDIVGWKVAKNRADSALQRAAQFAVAAAKAVQDAADPAVKQRLERAAERLEGARALVATARPEPTAATPELMCRDALLAALPPIPFPAHWRDPDRQAAILALFTVFQSQITTSDIEAFRAIISQHQDDEIARRFKQFSVARQKEFLERIGRDDIKRPAIAREVKRRAEKRRTAADARLAQPNKVDAVTHFAPAEAMPRATEGNEAIATGPVEPAPAQVSDQRHPVGDTPPHDLAAMLPREGAPASKATGARAADLPHSAEPEVDVASAQRMSDGPGTPGPHKNINYDKVGHPLSMLPRGTTLSSVKVGVDFLKESKPPEITDAVVLGAAPGSEAEIFVWNVIAQLGRKGRWGSEADLETAIGFPSPNGKAPIGKVTLRIDLAGKASAELLKGTVSTGTPFASLADATAKLNADFGVAAVTNASATWTLEELSKVHAALSTMSDGERAALVGVKLVREHTLPQSDGRLAAGQFGPERDSTTGTATWTDSLSLADSAFQNDKVSFVGGNKSAAPSSAEVVVHEAGHAVETQVVRDAQTASRSAYTQVTQDLAVFTQAQNDITTALDDFNPKSAAAFGRAKAYKPGDRLAMKVYLAAFSAATHALSALSRISTSQGSEAIEANAVAEVASRKAEKSKLAAAHASHPMHKDFAAAENAQDAWLAIAQKRAQALAALNASQAVNNNARIAEEATKTASGESRRLAKFVEFVNQHQIEPFTDYARNNWPARPAEFYAEAFSLVHTDPEFMQTNYKLLYNWFVTGEHLK